MSCEPTNGYDPQNHRVWQDSPWSPNANGSFYYYDMDGRRIGTYSWDGTDQLLTLDTTKGPEIYFLGRLESSPYGMPAANTPGQDAVGSAQGGGGYPYGESYSSSSTYKDIVGFATYTNDSWTGLDYAHNRYYSSNWGRFLNPDPDNGSMDPRSPLSFNRYVYVMGDPVNSNDPTGRDEYDECDLCFVGDGEGGGGDYGWVNGGPAAAGDAITYTSADLNGYSYTCPVLSTPCQAEDMILTWNGPGDDSQTSPSATASDMQVYVDGQVMNLSDAIALGISIPDPLAALPNTPGDDGLSAYRGCWEAAMLSYPGTNPELMYALGIGTGATVYAAGTTHVVATSTPALVGSFGTGLVGVGILGVTLNTMGAQAAMACSDATGYVPWILTGRAPQRPQRPRDPGIGPRHR